MKYFNILNLLFMLCALCSCEACTEDEWTTLPPKTQTGANTFGCYVDGELFVKGSAPWMVRPLSAEYQTNKDYLILECYSKIGHIYIELHNSQINTSMPISLIYYSPVGHRDCDYLGGKNIGEIILTKMDTINRIVSGRFQFPGLCSNRFFETTGDTIVSITDGRFDIKLDMYNN